MPQVIPTNSDGFSSFSVNAGIFAFMLETYWNSNPSMWFANIGLSDGTILVKGAALVPNVNLFDFSPRFTRKYGQFRIEDLTGAGNANDESLGNSAQLMYYTPGEFEALFPLFNAPRNKPLLYDFDDLFTIATI